MYTNIISNIKYHICNISSFRYTHVIISKKISIKINVATEEGNSRNEI